MPMSGCISNESGTLYNLHLLHTSNFKSPFVQIVHVARNKMLWVQCTKHSSAFQSKMPTKWVTARSRKSWWSSPGREQQNIGNAPSFLFQHIRQSQIDISNFWTNIDQPDYSSRDFQSQKKKAALQTNGSPDSPSNLLVSDLDDRSLRNANTLGGFNGNQGRCRDAIHEHCPVMLFIH